MKKIVSIISAVIFVIVAAVLISDQVKKMNVAKQNATEKIQAFLEIISAAEYEDIMGDIIKSDGTELSNQEMENFLINTGLYKTELTKKEDHIFRYNISTGFFDYNNVSVDFNFTTVSGEKVTNQLIYNNSDGKVHVTDSDIKNSKKKKKKYLVRTDGVYGSHMEYKKGDGESIAPIYRIVQGEGNKIYLEILEEAVRDYQLYVQYKMVSFLESFESKNEIQSIDWNEDFTEVNVMQESTERTLSSINLQFYSMMYQVLNETSDWKLTINYYDAKTKELANSEVVR